MSTVFLMFFGEMWTVIVLMGDGKILADLHLDELLLRLLEEKRNHEPLYLTALRILVLNLLLRRNRHMLILL